jgi:CHAT domain-containing protein
MLQAAEARTSSWVEQLSLLADPSARRALLGREAADATPALIEQIYDEVVRLTRTDLDRGERLAEALTWLAEDAGDDYARAQALRATGHILYLRGKYDFALTDYQSALEIFDRLGCPVDAARTISAALHVMAYAGRYDEALGLAERARCLFRAAGDQLRLARLDVNLANILYRQDRSAEALQMYESACAFLRAHGDPADLAIVLRNMAVCHLSLNQLQPALNIYREAREFCVTQDLPLLVAEADYNIAYLYYLRGEYMEAIAMYQAARQRCAAVGDAYHRSLCDLDQAEMYLELNLVEEAGSLAERALSGFRELGLCYETAKATTFLALATSRQGRASEALAALQTARQLFVQEKNQLWPALIDLYEAVVLFEQNQDSKSRRFCGAALRFFRQREMHSKAALCELLLARLKLRASRHRSANRHCHAALALVAGIEAPAIAFQAHMVLGQVLESAGALSDAFDSYRRAHEHLEKLRSHVQADAAKIAFLKDKLSVYEGLVCLSFQRDDVQQAFEFIERAKSRSLADMIAFRVHALRARSQSSHRLVEEMSRIGEELVSIRHQQTREELAATAPSPLKSAELAKRSRDCQRRYEHTASTLSAVDCELAALLSAGIADLETIQQCLAEDARVLEYYEARGTIYACVVGPRALSITPVARVAEVRRQFRLLQFQLSKFRLGSEFVQSFSSQIEAATDGHLQALYQALIAPVRGRLDHAGHLIIVPHGILHYVPFHALSDGSSFLGDQYSVSYAPSASVYHLCSTRSPATASESLILGVPDEMAPSIADEARSVAAVLPRPRLLLGAQATEHNLRQYAPASRVIHLATHGLFRQENPMFSSIRLADSSISLSDLYQLQLNAAMVTLSGCGTGLNVVLGGDELLGLVRGLLYAGARSVLVTLWDVNDASTSEFMTAFYRHWAAGANRAIALQRAARDLRQTHPHPYFWAPFVLIGNYL